MNEVATLFFKYIQWHNKAFHATKEILGIPTIVIEFEHFQHHLDVTTARLLRFLQLPKIKEPPNFVFNRCKSFLLKINICFIHDMISLRLFHHEFLTLFNHNASRYNRSFLYRGRKG